MTRAMFIIDVQNDFTEGGALGVEGGDEVARGISTWLRAHPGFYDHVIASRDWHNGHDDNGGHFSDSPDFVDSWPSHCVAGTAGADYDDNLASELVDIHVRKGQGMPAYSIFEGTTDSGTTLAVALDALGVTDIDVVGIATDYCVRASALDALAAGRSVRVVTDLIAGVAPESSAKALDELERAGAQLVSSHELSTTEA